MASVQVFDPDMLDETGCDKRKSFRQYGYGIRGITPVTDQFLSYSNRISGIGIISTRGVEDVYLVEGSVDGDMFLRFVRTSLLNVIMAAMQDQ